MRLSPRSSDLGGSRLRETYCRTEDVLAGILQDAVAEGKRYAAAQLLHIVSPPLARRQTLGTERTPEMAGTEAHDGGQLDQIHLMVKM
ncbi:hypothetical protein [Bradyrhizobium lablabi]|uniref:hypothetical protein n=1 Tax=Bradyrhizobium lablabi TaxID=722472 RepID=UPI001BA6C3DA|nr:hypothetical protein [Bradyrhizobium lablabi]MBR0692760.1 hypothetical protein [Bradyrhizobium lablabi]